VGERRKGSCDTDEDVAGAGLMIAGESVTAFSPRPDTLKQLAVLNSEGSWL